MSLDSLKKKLSDNKITNTVENSITGFLSTGYPELDYAISADYFNGGLPKGRMIEIFGFESSGKTAIATSVMINAQKEGGIGIFMDHEESFDSELAERFGLNTEFPHFIYQQPETYEESTDNAVKICETVREDGSIPPEAPIVLVFDSLASMIPQSKWVKDGAKDYNMHDSSALARCTSASMSVLAKKFKQLNVMCIFLNQIRMKIGVMFGDPTTTPGGGALPFYASVRIKLTRKILTEGTGKDVEKIGQEIGAECIKNKVSRPFGKAKWNFMYRPDGTGEFDVIGSLLNHMIEIGAIEQGGSRIKFGGKSLYKKEVVAGLRAREDGLKILTDMLKKFIEDGVIAA